MPSSHCHNQIGVSLLLAIPGRQQIACPCCPVDVFSQSSAEACWGQGAEEDGRVPPWQGRIGAPCRYRPRAIRRLGFRLDRDRRKSVRSQQDAPQPRAWLGGGQPQAPRDEYSRARPRPGVGAGAALRFDPRAPPSHPAAWLARRRWDPVGGGKPLNSVLDTRAGLVPPPRSSLDGPTRSQPCGCSMRHCRVRSQAGSLRGCASCRRIERWDRRRLAESRQRDDGGARASAEARTPTPGQPHTHRL